MLGLGIFKNDPLKTDIFPDAGVIEEINVGILLNYMSAKAFIMTRLAFSLTTGCPLDYRIQSSVL